MNFNFTKQHTKFHLGPPTTIIKHFSTMGAFDADHKTDFNSTNFGLKSVLTKLGGIGGISPNKSFSNPNFVNKKNPYILTSKLENVNFEQQQQQQHLNVQQPKKLDEDKSSHCSAQQNTEMPAAAAAQESTTKTMKKRRNKKNRKCKTQPPVVEKLCPKKLVCSAPKKLKKEPKSRGGKHKKDKPWHKISLDMEIMECEDEPTPECDEIIEKKKSCPIEILATTCKNISLSLSPCADFLKNLSTSSSTSDVSSMSPSSPAIRRLRLPSECDSEDSFIVFCDDGSSCMSAVDDLTDDDDSSSDSDFDFDVTDFHEKTDLNKGIAKKKVSFRCEPDLCEIHPMVKWGFAYQSARRGPWEQIARDRARFECRIRKTSIEISDVLDPYHRERIYHERFEEK